MYDPMAQTIKLDHIHYPAIMPILNQWQDYLISERRASKHTYSAYMRDVSKFLSFLCEYKGVATDKKILENLKPSDFRSYLAARRRDGLTPASMARSFSAVRSFYKYLRSACPSSS